MNRIRNIGTSYQVLITPNIKISPDSSLMIGNWEDEEFRNFHILEFPNLRDAQCEAYNHPDIDWHRIVLNHKHIFQRLRASINELIYTHDFTVEFIPVLMDPEMFKNSVFDRVQHGGERFNFRYGMNDIISFTIVNPWSRNLHKLAKTIESHREHLYRDDLRIRNKRTVDDKVLCLYGYTEFGTIYEIKLMPTLIYHWVVWRNKHGFDKDDAAENIYQQFLQQQDILDNGIVLR